MGTRLVKTHGVWYVFCPVNDLGGSEHGEGMSSRAADKVVEIIRSNGGTAVANYGETQTAWMCVYAVVPHRKWLSFPACGVSCRLCSGGRQSGKDSH